MPTYEYACTACGQHLEVHQRLTDDPLTTCSACGGALRKVFHPAGIVFKGSGFYATDSRSASKKTATASPSSGASTDGGDAPAASTSAASAPTSDAGGTTSAAPATPTPPPAAPAKAAP